MRLGLKSLKCLISRGLLPLGNNVMLFVSEFISDFFSLQELTSLDARELMLQVLNYMPDVKELDAVSLEVRSRNEELGMWWLEKSLW